MVCSLLKPPEIWPSHINRMKFVSLVANLDGAFFYLSHYFLSPSVWEKSNLTKPLSWRSPDMTEILLTGTLSNQNHISRAFNKGLHISDAFRATKKPK